MTKNPDIPEFGGGIFSVKDIAKLVHKPQATVNRRLNEFWNKGFGEKYGSYFFGDKHHKAVNFNTLVEFLTFAKLRENFSAQAIQKFHIEISNLLDTKYPFAVTKLLTDQKNVWVKAYDELIKLDGKKQFSLSEVLGPLLTKIDFDDELIARRYFPLGKDNSIVIDPKHQFGEPTIKGTNITASTIYALHRIDEPKDTIASEYNLSLKQVEDAIKFCESIAA